jgi:1-deoxy-D-xylulose-5-phosphate synthase
VIREGRDIQIWALGPWIRVAEDLADPLQEEYGVSIGVVNARFAKPLDNALLEQQAASAKLIVSMEDHVVMGGFGSAILEALADFPKAPKTERIGFPDTFVPHGTSVGDIRAGAGLDRQSILDRLRKAIEKEVTSVGQV